MERTWVSAPSNRRVTLMFSVAGGAVIAAAVFLGTWWSMDPAAPTRMTVLGLAAAFGTAGVLYAILALIQRAKNRAMIITLNHHSLRVGQDGEEVTLELANIKSADYLPGSQAITIRLRAQPPGWSPSPSSARTEPWARPIALSGFEPSQRAEILQALGAEIERHGGVVGGHQR